MNILVTDDDDDDVDTSWNDPCTTDTGGNVGDAVGVVLHLVVVGRAW